ncbi:MAG: secondary thiamine-phosphate synthase enzyme YjbQ [Myxococcota bacterium]
MIEEISVSTNAHDAFVDVTREVAALVQKSGKDEGVVTLFVPHTTAAVTIQENADPPLKADLQRAWERLFPWEGDYRHGEDNAAAHMKAAMLGPSVTVPFAGGRLVLGTWQSIYFCEFDGPRSRRLVVRVGD